MLAVVRGVLALYGLIAGMLCFSNGGLRRSDKWSLSFGLMACLLFGLSAVLLPRLNR